MASLTLRHGKDVGKRFIIGEGATIIGREAGVTIQIPDESVSRKHCVIKREGARFVVTDLASRHGTFVNGTKVADQELTAGDVLRLGDTVLVFAEEQEVKSAGVGPGMQAAFHETAWQMDQGKGVDTILAGLVGDVKKKDMERLAREWDGDAEAMRRRLRKMGWTSEESERFIEELEGRSRDDISGADIIEVQSPKANERLVKAQRRVKGAEPGNILRFQGKDYLVLSASYDEAKRLAEYRLKEC